jgi:GNAT superfamily N-acetyltransferase
VVSIVDIDPDDPARDAEFRAWVDVFLESARHELGDDHAGRTVAERRVRFRDASRRAIGVLARDEEGALVGAGWVVMPLLDNLRLAMVDLAVRPGHRRRGYGRALLCHLEGLAREHGRSLLVAQTQWHADGTDRSGGFASRVGYAAAQTNLRSSLALPVERNRLEAVLAERDGDGYALVTHVGVRPVCPISPISHNAPLWQP